MSLLARLFNFQASTPAVADDVDAELNQILNAINGTSTDKNLVTRFSGADAPYVLDQLGAGPIAVWRQGGSDKAKVNNSGQIETVHQFKSTLAPGTAPLDVLSTTKVDNLNADLLDDKHAAEWLTRWSMNWAIADPSTFPLGSFNLAQKVLVPGAGFIATAAMLTYASGSASGSFTVEIRKHPAGNQGSQTTLATLVVNPGSVGGQIEVDVNPDHTFTFEDYVYPILTARSSPLQRDVSIALIGTQPLA